MAYFLSCSLIERNIKGSYKLLVVMTAVTHHEYSSRLNTRELSQGIQELQECSVKLKSCDNRGSSNFAWYFLASKMRQPSLRQSTKLMRFLSALQTGPNRFCDIKIAVWQNSLHPADFHNFHPQWWKSVREKTMLYSESQHLHAYWHSRMLAFGMKIKQFSFQYKVNQSFHSGWLVYH